MLPEGVAACAPPRAGPSRRTVWAPLPPRDARLRTLWSAIAAVSPSVPDESSGPPRPGFSLAPRHRRLAAEVQGTPGRACRPPGIAGCATPSTTRTRPGRGRAGRSRRNGRGPVADTCRTTVALPTPTRLDGAPGAGQYEGRGLGCRTVTRAAMRMVRRKAMRTMRPTAMRTTRSMERPMERQSAAGMRSLPRGRSAGVGIGGAFPLRRGSGFPLI